MKARWYVCPRIDIEFSRRVGMLMCIPTCGCGSMQVYKCVGMMLICSLEVGRYQGIRACGRVGLYYVCT